MNLEFLPVLIKYVDSLVGLAAFIATCFVMVACRAIVKEVKDAQARTAEEYAEDKRRREDNEKLLHGRISSLEKQAGADFQTRRECVTQHDHINKELADVKDWGKGIELKLDLHTTQILTAIQKGKA